MKFKQYLIKEYDEEIFIDEIQLEEGGGSFSYNSQWDKENHMTIKGLMKNNGVFKSTKQKWYLLEKRWKHSKVGSSSGEAIFKTPTDAKKLRNIPNVQMGDYIVEVSAAMTFGKRGMGQGYRRIEWGYIIDAAGVKEEWKYGFKYEDGGERSGLDFKKMKKTWQRKETPEVKEFLGQDEEEKMKRDQAEQEAGAKLKASEWIGNKGERVKGVEITVLRKNFFETQYGESAITIMQDSNGNMIKHFGKNNLKKGDIKTVDFTVKAHEKEEVNKWNKIPYKVTSVSRVKG